MKDIWKRLKKYRLPLVSAFVMLVLSTVCSVTLPTLMTNIVDYGINAKDIDYVYRTCAIMAAVTAAPAEMPTSRPAFSERDFLVAMASGEETGRTSSMTSAS